MSIPPPPPALLRLTRKAVSLLGNGSDNKYILWQLPQCTITSNPYGLYTGTYGLLNCIAIEYGAVSAVVWFYEPPGGQGALLSYQNVQYPKNPGSYHSVLYVGTDGALYAGDYNIGQVTTAISPGWHMVVFEVWTEPTTPYRSFYVVLYLDGQFIGSVSSYGSSLFGKGSNYPYSDIGSGQACGQPGVNTCNWFFFNGVIAYVALYNRVLRPDEVVAIYQGNSVTNGLVAEYSGDTYDPSSGVWFDDVGNNNAQLVLQSPTELIDLTVPAEFTSGINYDLLAQKIAEKIAGKPINIANLPINDYGNLNIGTPDQWGFPYIDLNAIANAPLKGSFSVLSNASITSNGSTGNYSTYGYRNFLVTIYVGSVSGTSPSLTVYFNAYDGYSGQSIPMASVTLTSAGGTYIYVHDFPGNAFNISWVVGGASPSFGSVLISVYESW